MRPGPELCGFSLAEVAVALVLLSVTGLGALTLLGEAAARARAVDHAERRIWAALQVADSVASGALRGTGSRTLPDGSRLHWVDGPGGRVDVQLPGTDSVWLRLPAPVDGVEPVPGSGAP